MLCGWLLHDFTTAVLVSSYFVSMLGSTWRLWSGADTRSKMAYLTAEPGVCNRRFAAVHLSTIVCSMLSLGMCSEDSA